VRYRERFRRVSSGEEGKIISELALDLSRLCEPLESLRYFLPGPRLGSKYFHPSAPSIPRRLTVSLSLSSPPPFPCSFPIPSTMPPGHLVAITSDCVWLPGRDEATPATLIVSLEFGTIVKILPSRLSREELQEEVNDYVDYRDKWILPGVSSNSTSFLRFFSSFASLPFQS